MHLVTELSLGFKFPKIIFDIECSKTIIKFLIPDACESLFQEDELVEVYFFERLFQVRLALLVLAFELGNTRRQSFDGVAPFLLFLMFDALDHVVELEDFAQLLKLLRAILRLPAILRQRLNLLNFELGAPLAQRHLSLRFVFLSLARGILLQESVHSVDFGALPHMLKSIIKRFAEKVEMRLCLRDCVVNLVVIRQENLLLLAKVVHIDQGLLLTAQVRYLRLCDALFIARGLKPVLVSHCLCVRIACLLI